MRRASLTLLLRRHPRVVVLLVTNLDRCYVRPQPASGHLAERSDMRRREVGRGRAAKVEIDHVREVEVGGLCEGSIRFWYLSASWTLLGRQAWLFFAS